MSRPGQPSPTPAAATAGTQLRPACQGASTVLGAEEEESGEAAGSGACQAQEQNTPWPHGTAAGPSRSPELASGQLTSARVARSLLLPRDWIPTSWPCRQDGLQKGTRKGFRRRKSRRRQVVGLSLGPAWLRAGPAPLFP